MTTITCKVPKELAVRLQTQARKERRSKSSLIREALEQRLEAEQKGQTPRALDLAKHLSGSLKGGPTDLATDPRHLDKFGQ